MADEIKMDSAGLADSMMADLGVPSQVVAPVKSPEPVPEPTAPKADAPSVPAKPATPAAAPKAADKPAVTPAAPTPTPDDEDKVKDPVELRKRLKTIKQEYAGFKLSEAQKEEKLRKEISAYASRKYLTPEQEAEQEKMVTRLAEMERKVYAHDYQSSPDFKKNFTDKFQGLWDDAVSEVVGIPIAYQEDVNGEMVDKQRAATAKDLSTVLDAPPADRFLLADKLFGKGRELVLEHVRGMVAVRKAAKIAVEEKQKNYESEIQTQSATSQKQQQDYDSFLKTASDNLAKSRPDLYSPDESNPEATAALEKGMNFVRETLTNVHTFDVNTRAARVALIQNFAAALPRVAVERDQWRAKAQQLEAELAKFRKTDPGSGGDGGGVEEVKDETPKGSDALADTFGKVP